jgi:hypothetical protein
LFDNCGNRAVANNETLVQTADGNNRFLGSIGAALFFHLSLKEEDPDEGK